MLTNEELMIENTRLRSIVLEQHNVLLLADKFVSWTPQQRIEANWGPYTDIKEAIDLWHL
jgi:hypothetical protein